MASYNVSITARALRDLDAIAVWYHHQKPGLGAAWIEEVLAAIDVLSEHPQRCPVTHLYTSAHAEFRQLLFGKKHGQYRIFFKIKGKTVYVESVRHTRQESA